MQEKTGAEPGFHNHANENTWMTLELFVAWLKRFEAYIRKTAERKVALPIHNCIVHGTVDSMVALNNVEVLILPPSTTSKIQPMDAGVIVSVKML